MSAWFCMILKCEEQCLSLPLSHANPMKTIGGLFDGFVLTNLLYPQRDLLLSPVHAYSERSPTKLNNAYS